MVSVLVADWPPLGEIDIGLKLQLDSAGRALQEKLTIELKPFSGVTVKTACPLCPALIVRDVGFPDTVKVGAEATVSVCGDEMDGEKALSPL